MRPLVWVGLVVAVGLAVDVATLRVAERHPGYVLDNTEVGADGRRTRSAVAVAPLDAPNGPGYQDRIATYPPGWSRELDRLPPESTVWVVERRGVVGLVRWPGVEIDRAGEIPIPWSRSNL